MMRIRTFSKDLDSTTESPLPKVRCENAEATLPCVFAPRLAHIPGGAMCIG